MELLEKVGSIRTSQLTLTATPQILASEKVRSRAYNSRIGLTFINNTATKAYIGDKDVTENTGIPVKAGETFTISVTAASLNNGVFVIGSGSAAIAEYFA